MTAEILIYPSTPPRRTPMSESFTGSTKSSSDDISPNRQVESSAAILLPPELEGYDAASLARRERSLVRKLDTRILPVVGIMFLLNNIDKSALPNARLGGLEKDLEITDHQYDIAIMIYFCGFIAPQIPLSMLLPRSRPSLFLSGFVLAAGVASLGTGAVQGFAGLATARFFVGLLEAPFLFGSTYLLSCHYTRSELPLRISILHLGSFLASAFGGLIAAGVLAGLDGAHGIKGWRYVFVVEGSLTIGVAIVASFLLPDWPESTRWLNSEEKALARYRLALDSGGEEHDDGANWWDGFVMCLKDPLVLVGCLLFHCISVSNSFVTFFPSIVKTLGYDHIQTLLLTAPPHLASFAFAILIGYTSGRTGERSLHIVIPLGICALGTILAMTLPSTAGRYVSMFLMAMGPPCVLCIYWSWKSTLVPRPRAKRSAAFGLGTMVSSSSHFYTSYLFPSHDKPRYITGGSVVVAACAAASVVALVLRYLLSKRNRELQRIEDEGGVNPFGHGFRHTC